jgi:F0F1-type ATP synthase assembly protein I
MSQHDDPNWRQAIRSAGLIGYLGFAIALPIAAGAWLGYLVDQKLGTSGAVAVLGILAGVAAGGVSAYTIIMRAIAETTPGQRPREDNDHGSKRTNHRDT